VGDDTAQKRVSRALDKLREHLSRRGISSTATALSIVLCANAVQAAPAGLAVTISTAALAGTILTTTATATAVKTIAMTTLQKTIIAAALATAVGTGVYEARQASRLQDQVQSLQQQQAEQSQLLQRERDEANRLASALSKVQTESGNPKELLQLRTEVTRLRKQAEAFAADAKEAKDSQSDMMQMISNTPPIRTFVSTAMITTAWNQAIVTGGWKTPSGRHAIVVATASPVGSNGNTVRPGDNLQQLNIKSYVLEYTEDAGTATGLAEFNTDGQSATKATELSADQFEAIRKAADNHDGIEIITLQSVTTASGRHTEVETVDTHQTPSGEKYSTGPVIDLIPSIASDGQSVQMMISAHLNYLVQAPKH